MRSSNYRNPIAVTAHAGCALALSMLVGCSSSSHPTTDTTPLIEAPASDVGFQLGAPPFDVPEGVETQRCYFVEVPSDEDVWVNRITLALNPGSHHLNVFRVNTVVALGGKPGDVVVDGECFKSGNWADWPLVINSQNSQPGHNINDWQLPDGVAHHFHAHELLMLQTHFVNATTQSTPGVGQANINFYYDKASAAPVELGTIFATNQSIKVCPGQAAQSFTATCHFARAPVTIVAANGHFHSRGTDFRIAPFDATSGPGADFYDSQSWDDPVFLKDLSIPVNTGGGISYTCQFAASSSDCGDPNNGCCFTFGGKVESQEHCNAFVYYYPKQGTDINCF